jgi:hypothetical protein
VVHSCASSASSSWLQLSVTPVPNTDPIRTVVKARSGCSCCQAVTIVSSAALLAAYTPMPGSGRGTEEALR